jgi:aspartyl aminopeptidase
MERTVAWTEYNKTELKKLETVAKEYRSFLDAGKTERECVKGAVRLASAAGYRDLKELIANNEALKPGDRVYADCMGKAIMLFIVGRQPMERGFNIIGAHIDSPRMDLKQNPLYEDTGLAYLDTHYYGGIKKYQWVTIPLALHGVVAKKDGTLVDFVIGEDENDPVVGISDLLIHLSADQMQKKASVVIEGEELNVIIGGVPLKGEEKEPVKANMLKILKEKYDIDKLVSGENFDIISDWMTKHVYKKADRLDPKDWILDITGEEPRE